MKKLISVFLLVCALPAAADSYRHHESHFRGPGHRPLHYSYGDWVAPMIIGGGLVYLATRPAPVAESIIQSQPVCIFNRNLDSARNGVQYSLVTVQFVKNAPAHSKRIIWHIHHK